jgi:hypothetical protein
MQLAEIEIDAARRSRLMHLAEIEIDAPRRLRFMGDG